MGLPRMWDTGKYSYARGIVHHMGLSRKLRTVFDDHVTGRHLLLSLDARQRVTQRDDKGTGVSRALDASERL